MEPYQVLKEDNLVSKTNSEHSSDHDQWRTEEPWQENTENLLRRWREDCTRASQSHDISGKRYKKLGHFWTIPSAILPALAAPLVATSHASRESFVLHTIETFVLVISGVCGVINSTLQYSARSEKHFAFSARYYDLVTDIDLELSKRRAYRMQADVFLTKVQMTYDALNNAAPV